VRIIHPRRRIAVMLGLVSIMAACVATPANSSLTPTLIATSTVETRPTVSATITPTSSQPDRSPQIVDQSPCPDSKFTCLTLRLPIDHFDPTNPRTIDVVFAVLRASGQRKGMFVTAVGGPGASGLAASDAYLPGFDSSIRKQFDIVFFDQRGIGRSGGMECIKAAAAFYQTDARAETPAEEAALIEAARKFVTDCLAEMGSPPTLPYLGTRQAVEDLEAFRQSQGDEQFWLYGESYGTQFAQVYAAEHPEQVAGLILDGTVDLTLSASDFLAQQTRAFSEVLSMTLDACNASRRCRDDLGGDAAAAYDRLAAQLQAGPVSFEFTTSSDKLTPRTLTLAQFENAVTYNLYDETSRVSLLQALASAQADDLEPLARLAYEALGLDPDTLEAVVDPTFSNAAYYAINCNDYIYFEGTPDERAQAYLRSGDAVEASVPRLSSIYYGDLPCVFWPTPPTPPQNLSVTANIPTLVLGAMADPATPVSNGEAVYRRLKNGYLITTQGGSHVTYGWGNSCPDDLVTAFLVDDQMPRQRETTCPGVIIDRYTSP
jgi:pimeloyl-ACP methyl ester carboxylesterase